MARSSEAASSYKRAADSFLESLLLRIGGESNNLGSFFLLPLAAFFFCQEQQLGLVLENRHCGFSRAALAIAYRLGTTREGIYLCMRVCVVFSPTKFYISILSCVRTEGGEQRGIWPACIDARALHA